MDKSIRRWTWDERTGPERLAARLKKDGLLWFRMPDAPEHAMRAPLQFVERILSLRPKFVASLDLMPSQENPLHRADFDFHTDIGTKVPYVPPRYLILVCIQQAPTGGASTAMDSWQLLSRIRKISPALHSRLLWMPQAQRHTPNIDFGPVYSSRFGSLIAACGVRALVRDPLGILFAEAHAKGDHIHYRMSPGDVTIVDNYRFFHARGAYKGSRQIHRLLVWPAKNQEQGRCHWAAEAEEAREFLSPLLREEGPLAQRAFGMLPYGEKVFVPFPTGAQWEKEKRQLLGVVERMQKAVAERL